MDEHRLVALKCAFKDPTVHDCRRLAMHHPMGDRLVGLAEILLTCRRLLGGGSHHVIAPPAARSSETKKVSAFYLLLHFSWGPTMFEIFVQDFSHNSIRSPASVCLSLYSE